MDDEEPTHEQTIDSLSVEGLVVLRINHFAILFENIVSSAFLQIQSYPSTCLTNSGQRTCPIYADQALSTVSLCPFWWHFPFLILHYFALPVSDVLSPSTLLSTKNRWTLEERFVDLMNAIPLREHMSSVCLSVSRTDCFIWQDKTQQSGKHMGCICIARM